MQGDFAASCGENLSHSSKVRMDGSRSLLRTDPHSDFGLHDALFAPLQSLILREATYVVIASKPQGNLFRCSPCLLTQFANCSLLSVAFLSDHELIAVGLHSEDPRGSRCTGKDADSANDRGTRIRWFCSWC